MIHGGDIYRNKIRLDFSVNTNPFGTPPEVLSAVKNAVNDITHYPDPEYADLKKAIAEYEGVDPEAVIVANGASELITAAAMALNAKSVAMPVPAFSGYERAFKAAGEMAGGEVTINKVTDDFSITAETVNELIGSSPEAVILGNPNNPTGRLMDREVLELLICETKKCGIRLIIDESFMELSKASGTAKINDKYDHALRIKSLTKCMAIPGARLGYGISFDGKFKDKIEKLLSEWNVSIMADAAGRAAMDLLRSGYMSKVNEYVSCERKYLTEELTKREIKVYPSDTNFLLLHSQKRELYRAMLDKGILIRDCSNFNGLGAGWYRIAVKLHEENEELIRCLDAAAGGGKYSEMTAGAPEASETTAPADEKKAAINGGSRKIEHVLPADIEKNSFSILTAELSGMGVKLEGENAPVIKRAIHTTADFDYAGTLVFSENAVSRAKELIKGGADIVTDTNMALSGINKKELAKYGGSVHCFMADPLAARLAKERGVTRAAVSMELAAELARDSNKKIIFAIGNAPTALIKLREMLDAGTFTPDFIIGVPVGFVNVEAAKELIIETKVPHIVNRGRKGGSNVAAAIVNAVLYQLRDDREIDI